MSSGQTERKWHKKETGGKHLALELLKTQSGGKTD